MLLYIVLFLLSFLHSHAQGISDERRSNITNVSYTDPSVFDRVSFGYDFKLESSGEEIPFNVCYKHNYIAKEVRALHNFSGYVYCTLRNQGIKQMCPPGTEVSREISECINEGCVNKGCVNKTTNTPVFPIGSRCASQPCQNGGACFDFSSVDRYLCKCSYPYKGFHCQLRGKSCPESQCGGTVGKFVAFCKTYAHDMALDYICLCYDWNRQPVTLSYAANNCHTDELFVPKCEGKPPVNALPFTNKGFYICPSDMTRPFIRSCALHHVWNDTQKACVIENN